MHEVSVIDADDTAALSPERLGREGFELLQVAQKKLRIVPTHILATGVYEQYRYSGQLVDDVVASVLAFTSAAEASEVTIRPSTALALIGLPGWERVEIDRGRIKYVIERIFRSWEDDRAKSYRITHGIADADALPAVIVQVLGPSDVYTLSTRNPRDGQVTDEQNYGANINNRIELFRTEYASMLDTVEGITKRPTQVCFEDENGPKIVGLEEQVRTVPALLFFLQSMHQAGRLDNVEVLQQLEPYMMGEAKGEPSWKLDPNAAVAVIGLPGAPGTASGRVIWHMSPEEIPASEPCVLLVDEYLPDDYHLLIRCVGGIATRGGTNSHFAVTCRGEKIPAVVGAAEAKLDVASQTLRIGDREFRGRIYTYVDGDSGTASFSDDRQVPQPRLIRRSRRFGATTAAESYIDWIDGLARSLVEQNQFKELPIPTQTHIAELRFAIRKIRAGQ